MSTTQTEANDSLRTRWEGPGILPQGRASRLHFAPVEGTVLDLDSLDSLVWADHDALWTFLRGVEGGPDGRGLILEGLQLRRREHRHFVQPGRCIIPLRGSGRLVLAELREAEFVRMDYGALVLRAEEVEVRTHGARASSSRVVLSAHVVQVEEMEPTDLPVEFNRQEQGRVVAYRDLRRLDSPDAPRVQRHVKRYRELVELVWAGGAEGESTTGQAVINIPMSARVRSTAALEAASARLLSAPSTSLSRLRLYDMVREVFNTMQDFSDNRNASRRLINQLAELDCDQAQARRLTGAED